MKYPTTEAGWWRSEFETTCELLRAERKKIAALTAVVDAAQAVYHQYHTGEGLRPEDSEWSTLGAALEALDGAG